MPGNGDDLIRVSKSTMSTSYIKARATMKTAGPNIRSCRNIFLKPMIQRSNPTERGMPQARLGSIDLGTASRVIDRDRTLTMKHDVTVRSTGGPAVTLVARYESWIVATAPDRKLHGAQLARRSCHTQMRDTPHRL